LQLLPLSVAETAKVSLLRGGFPEVLARPSAARLWFQSYIQTYLERDVRAVTAIRDLSTFRRFLTLAASRSGQMLNRTDLAAPLGVSVPTAAEWMSILEVTGQVLMIPPFFENFGKRLVKSPKVYFVDCGLLCHLLGIETERALRRSPFLGPIFEGFVASEIVKHQLNAGRRRELYYFRDQQGLEVDFLVPQGERRLAVVEAKATATPKPEMADSVVRFSRAADRYDTNGFVVHQSVRGTPHTTALRPGVKAVGLPELLSNLRVR
jgi:predicted AAA+ superfamily ATPase